MIINDEEFQSFINEIISVGKKYGIEEGTITSVLAEAIKNREDILGNSQEKKEQQESIKDVVEIYGIPKVEFEEQVQDVRCLYGIPRDMQEMFSEKTNNDGTARIDNSYTPMTDEEIQSSREKLL